MTETTINILPREILINIFSYLNLQEIVGCSEVCKEIKGILKKRLIPVKGMLEKSELKKALLDSDPQDSIPYFPKWKASYIAAEKDSKRTTITKEELCTTEWSFKFKQWPEDHPGIKAYFKPDYTYVSDLFDHELKWRFYAGDVQGELC
ncbi:hypothetical protein HDV06_003928 [Boothiomyces sp. JEL0866]|nr:hypothetical protein HDV06_003928 [Boothiomyces sp. JEL0866]